MKEKRHLRDKPFYAVWASVFISIMCWACFCVTEMALEGDWLEMFPFLVVIQVTGYCVFERRYRGKSLFAYNSVYFVLMIPVNVAGMFLAWQLVETFGSPGGFFWGIQFPFYLGIIYTILFNILIVRIMIALLCQGIKGGQKGRWFQAVNLIGFLLVAAFFLYQILSVAGVVRGLYEQKNSHDVSYSETDPEYDIDQKEYNRRFDQGMVRNHEKSKEEENLIISEKEEASEPIELDPDINVDQEEYDSLVKIAEQLFDEKWSEMEVREWYAAEWICFQNEYHLRSINLQGSDQLGGKLDLSRFRFLENIDLSYSNVKEVVFPEYLKKLHGKVFEGCQQLKTVTFGNKIKEISEDSFYYCDSLKKIVFQGDAPQMTGWIRSWSKADIYYPPSQKGWTDPYWEQYNMIPRS